MPRPTPAVRVAAVLAAAAAAWTATAGPARVRAADAAPVTLRRAAGGHPLMGTCLMAYQLDKPALADLVAAQFDCVTPENELKPDATEPRPGEFTFAAADKLLAFTDAHGMKLVGHNLCWHSQTPKWMYQDADGKPLSREVALANLKRHIDGVAGHFKGKVLGWDVVNEALSDTPGEYLRNSPARKAIGDDFIVQAFKFAQAADPNAELYYNDYNNENPGKRDAQIKLIRELKAAGCRLDAVGIQGHWMLKYPGAASVLEDAIKAFSAEGVKVSVTELDIDVLPRKTNGANVSANEKGADLYPNGLPPDVEAQVDAMYGKIFAAVERHKDVVERVTLWGTHDGTSWLNDWPVKGRHNYPLLWDRDLKPKPAFDAVIAALTHGPAAASAAGGR